MGNWDAVIADLGARGVGRLQSLEDRVRGCMEAWTFKYGIRVVG